MPSRAAGALGRASILAEYSARHWRSGWWLNLRRLASVVVVLSFMVALAGFVPAMRFQATAAFDHAGYAVRANGLVTQPRALPASLDAEVHPIGAAAIKEPTWR